MAKRIISIGLSIPGEIEIEDQLPYRSRRSLLDADIALFCPNFHEFDAPGTYLGKGCLNDDDSFELKETRVHWKTQILTMVESGKTVFLFTTYQEMVYVATGQHEFSGTGRNRKTTRLVEEHHPYSDVPADLGKILHSQGTRMKLTKDAEALSAYWDEFGKYTQYEVYFEGIKAIPLLVTQSGEKVVGCLIRTKSGGLLVILPEPDLEQMSSSLEEEMQSGAK
jgi:hypothetical protein